MSGSARELLFSTPHGSHLYGLARPDSDRDTYEVYTNAPRPYRRAKWSKQTIDGDSDVTRIDFSSWMHQCAIGVPQALEAMFSQQATYDQLAAFRAAFRVGTGAQARYERTIRTFATDPRNTTGPGAFKRRRHAVRLAVQGRQLAQTGRFAPTLTDYQAGWVTAVTEVFGDDGLGLLAFCREHLHS